jgi:hypothetical protein
MMRLLVILGLFLCYSWPSGKVVPVKKEKRVFIGVDGLSHEQFQFAREKLGLFKTLKFNQAHISTFPSISDYSWNVMVGAKKVNGRKGRIRSYEAAHYDRDRNELVSDPREYFRRLGAPHHYFTGAFSHWLNPFVESLLYIPTEELPRLELKQLLSAVKDDKKDLVTVMVASSDALAHTRADGADFLFELDRFISDIEAHFPAAEIIVVSDHGQASRFHPGEKALPLLPVDLNPLFKKANLVLSTELKDDNDIALPVMALANYGSLHFKNPDKKTGLIDAMKKEKWFSLAISPQTRTKNEVKLSVSDSTGEALLTIRKNSSYEYFYETVNSDPFKLPLSEQKKWLSDEEVRSLLAGSEFPDAFYRIAFSAFEEEADFPDLIFTLKDEYYISGEFNSLTKMFQTHGSLGRRSSTGIVASTKPLKLARSEVRTEEILSSVGLTPEEVFQSSATPVLKAPSGQVATGSEDWSNRRIFALMNHAVQESKYLFDAKSFSSILSIVKPFLDRKTPTAPATNWKEAVSLADVAHLVDLMIRNGNVEKVKSDPKFMEMKSRLALIKKDERRSPSNEGHFWENPDHIREADAAKKFVMKSYSSTFLLEKALMIPEFPFIPDTRISKSDMFPSIFAERKLLSEIFPQKLALQWEPGLPPENVTLVYIPGIYNSLFDDEIFRNALDHLKNNWGVRIIAPKVFSTCSSSVNGKLIIDALKEDSKKEISRGKDAPKYFIMGYSKGGVDALHAFTLDPEFIEKHVSGLVTIAAPIRGSSILNKADLPFEVMELFGNEKAPKICRHEEKASRFLTPAAAQAFLRKNSAELAGLTKYYSLSFESDLKDSHLFMRATKTIGRFGEPNDGVVTVKASQFPEEFGAVHLGTVKADHLAGIVASHFPHQAFMESVIFTLTKLEAFKEHSPKLEEIAYQSKFTKAERHKKNLSAKIGKVVSGLFSPKGDTGSAESKIKELLRDTRYALKPFSLIKKKNVVHVSFREGRWPSVSGGSAVPINSENELYELFLSALQLSGKNLLKNGKKEIPESERAPVSAPMNELGYHEDLRLNLRELDKFISGKKVSPMTAALYPDGVAFTYDHASSAEFRNEYQLSYEDSSPADADDNSVSGWETIVQDGEVWGRLTSQKSSIRLTTYSWRFLASEFPELDLEIQVNQDVPGSNVLYGGDGKDDSAFQLWFTFRMIDDQKQREYLTEEDKMMTIGYYFGDEIPGKKLEVNGIYQNYYSEKDFIVARLPAAKQKLIGIGEGMKGKPFISHNDLLEDIKNAYPEIDSSKAEIVAITIQHDSNDTQGKSEALFKSFRVRPHTQKKD